MSKPIVVACSMDASFGGTSTPPPWHTDAVGGRPPHHPIEPIPKGIANGRSGASLCENVRKPRIRRMVFLYCLLPLAPPELLVFRSTKSRRTFYAHDERLRFHTASVECRRLHTDRGMPAYGADLPLLGRQTDAASFWIVHGCVGLLDRRALTRGLR